MILKKDKLTVKIYTTTKEMSVNAARDVSDQIKELLKEKEYINMIFAAAPSQSEFLKELTSHKEIDWSRINAFHLDEYINLSEDAPQRFGNFLKKEIFGLLPFRKIYYLDGNKPIDEECKRYADLLKKYPPNIVCLGIGENGHIAFNDPHVARFDDEEMVKVVVLDEMCRQQQVNDKCFDKLDDVPTEALTLTIPTLLLAQYLFCIVPFRTKAQAVFNTINGKISEVCPASALRTKDNAVLYLDRDSSALLNY
ncbi:glucosamine-6-phosphate deaminase [Dysgonomonas hofstadii]|uniref:Glucosamine-6-phosphate deaminase n=1 Tax=Dysgonomonas hofstadii TaxID=637886 RepID=A0A840CG36_9BACT|nr:6-phosphogluconolactonase [Dysgonomonas hofstadii]MBB4034930.1 glucosamine-6-phosphate deaminase [Dysgonomonas hofstadii]